MVLSNKSILPTYVPTKFAYPTWKHFLLDQSEASLHFKFSFSRMLAWCV